METGNHHEEVRGAIAFLRSIPLRISALESELAEARCKNAKTARLVRDAVREKIGAKHENSRAQTRVRELEEENARLGGVVSECAQLLPIAGPLPDRVHFLRTSHDQLRAALNGLRNETRGFVGAYGESMRPFCGNTNLAVLEHWIEQASAALGRDAGRRGWEVRRLPSLYARDGLARC